ncbi:CPBP family intramembrane glutamic endopeptidase [Flagellimonas zhangzhouensis]|uniref:CAAX protease self-immunity n=1 Tax=Flagellimonas zhangzhouensis TaxID=1073328 RepID=A0A1H2V0B5_9FLAO|nr:type II CAAX endopeptidase family protein [Allomuricauda zhangzhouensis]SDQ12060.1 CAAX protease self-immunity [Allomuricauda zhangzhouensis]SDW61751.1 CAAX protease self-immunity [Allomuricauda zhangzhouensis]
MTKSTTEKKEAWNSLGIFFLLLITFSSIAYYAILKLNPTSIYVGLLMMCPALASFLTLKIKGRPISSLPWSLNNLTYLKFSYFTPILYVSIAYILLWIFGFGSFFNAETISEWSAELGIAESNQTLVLFTMVGLLLTVGVIKNLGSTLGEEIGWRGFLIFELRKVMSFKALAIVSGVIWAVWHYPIINLMYSRGDSLLLHISAFTLMIVGMSVVLAYYTFKSNSLWPAAIFHSVHNIYIQKICTPLTISNESTSFWIDEYGFMIPIVTTVFAVYFWVKAGKEGL